MINLKTKEFILTLSCLDTLGIVAAVTNCLAENNLFILELSQFSDPSTEQFFMRVDFRVQDSDVNKNKKEISQFFAPVAQKFRMNFSLHDKNYKPKLLILVSKQGHCLNDLLHRESSNSLSVEISGVLSNHEDLKPMTERYEKDFYFLPNFKAEKLFNLVEKLEIDLIILARYMQILSPSICEKYSGKIINIHHSFLPSFKGAKPYAQAYERGVKLIGATAHYVTKKLDEGPIIDQETVRVRHDHTAQQLSKFGENIESTVLARAISYQIQQRVFLNNNKTIVFS